MLVYARTEEGQLAAYSPQSVLPRKLKSILKVIDGKTRTHVFEQNLQSFGNVRAILQSLESDGLIYATSEDAQRVRFNLDLSEPERQKLMQANNTSEWAATRTPLEGGLPQQALGADKDWPFDSAMVSHSSQAVDRAKAAALASLVNEMSNFVLTCIPEQSFQILKEIEEVSSLEILAATLGGYEQMVSHLGDQGKQHVRHIKSILRDNL